MHLMLGLDAAKTLAVSCHRLPAGSIPDSSWEVQILAGPGHLPFAVAVADIVLVCWDLKGVDALRQNPIDSAVAADLVQVVLAADADREHLDAVAEDNSPEGIDLAGAETVAAAAAAVVVLDPVVAADNLSEDIQIADSLVAAVEAVEYMTVELWLMEADFGVCHLTSNQMQYDHWIHIIEQNPVHFWLVQTSLGWNFEINIFS
jgi:hypothetical protein